MNDLPLMTSPARIFTAAWLVLLLLPAAYADTVTLTGQTRLPQLPEADVTIWIGDQSTEVAADENGRFSADLEVTPGPELIRVEACGVGDQAHVCFVRLVHTASEMVSRAAASGSYRVGDLSPVSTAAWAALLKPIPEEVIPVTFADIEQFQFGFASAFILSDAALLSLIVRGEATMPAGAADLVSVLLDQTLKNSALSSVSGELQVQESQSLTQNDNLMLQPDQDFDILGKTYLVALTETAGFITSLVDLNEDGPGLFASAGASGTTSWINVDQGEVIFRDDMERVGTGTRYISLTAPDRESITPPSTFFVSDPDGDGAVRLESRLLEVQWRQLDASEMLSVALLRTTFEVTAPDRPDLGPEEVAFLGISSRTVSSVSRGENAIVPPSPLPTAGSQWAFPRCEPDCSSPSQGSELPSFDVLSFNSDGSASARILDPGMNWTVSDGRVLIEQDDGFTLDILPFGSTTRRPPDLGDLETTLIVTEVTNPDGGVAVSSNFVLEADPGFVLTDESVPGIYDVRDIAPGTYILEDGGTGWRRPLGSFEPDGPLPSEPPNLTWSISPAEDLVIFFGFKIVSTPVRGSPSGFYSITRFGLPGADPDPEDFGGSLIFWEEIGN